MAAVWLALLALNLTADRGPAQARHPGSRSGPGLLALWREQRQWLQQSLEPPAPPPVVHPKPPGPRSEQTPAVKLG
jgi:hypothetical protein